MSGDDGRTWQEQLPAMLAAEDPRLAAAAAVLIGRQLEPERSLQDLRRFLESAGSFATQVRSLAADPLALQILVDLGSHSRYGMEMALRRPQVFWEIVQERGFRNILGKDRFAAEVASATRSLTDPLHRINALVRLQQYHHLRIMIGDIEKDLPLGAVTLELSDLADCIIQSVLDLERERFTARHGACPGILVVLGLGKLGGRELNYSSDIDLLFSYEAHGDASGLKAHEYFCRLGSDLVNTLDAHHGAGRLYRVDMRLRPEGASGELALSLRETIDYYYGVGRAWERQALSKARTVAGEASLGERLLAELRPWIYPVEHDWSELTAARLMRRRIEERGDEADIKTGEGGIRDIEFLVQSLQLGYGGRVSSLRERSTLKALQTLAAEGLLSRFDAAELEMHYRWLRMVEHRLQMYENRQIHDIPADPARLARLAFRCDFAGRDGPRRFQRRLEAVRRRVRELSQLHYLDGTSEHDAFHILLASEQPPADLARRLLEPAGFRDVPKAVAWLHAMADEPFFVLSRGRTQRSLIRLLPELLSRVTRTPDPDATLANFHRVVQAVGGRSPFFDLLHAKPELLGLFVDLSGWANFAVALLNRFPGLADDLAERNWVFHEGESDLAAEAAGLVQGLGDPVEPLAYMQARELLQAVIGDLRDIVQDRICSHLSRLARAVVTVLFEHATKAWAGRWGMPLAPDGSPCRLAVLGLGKLGGGEMTYFSDVDVILVCDGDGRTADGAHGAAEFWTRVAQTVLQWGKDGRLYEIDARLRPWGDQGELVVSLSTLRSYWGERRDLWERLAMMRIAPLAGDADLAREAAALIHSAAIAGPLPPDMARQVRSMRARLEDNVSGRDHVKRGWGGYVDVEFLAGYLSLGRDPALLPPGLPIAATLERLAGLGLLDATAARECADALALLRRMESRIRLSQGRTLSSLPTEIEPRTRLARICGFPSLQAMDQALHQARQQARKWLEHYVPAGV